MTTTYLQNHDFYFERLDTGEEYPVFLSETPVEIDIDGPINDILNHAIRLVIRDRKGHVDFIQGPFEYVRDEDDLTNALIDTVRSIQ